MNKPTVFISYSHDSPEHDDRVLALSNRLRKEGIDCTLDQYEDSPAEGWPKWMDRQIERADFVLVVCTETYCRRVMGTEEQGKGLGVRWESTLTYQHLYDTGGENTRFIPVLFESADVEHIPTPLRGATHYCLDTEQGYEDLYRRLTNQPETPRPELGKLRALPPRERKPDFLTTEIIKPPKISLAKMPSTSPDLFGRDDELAMLDAAWENPQTCIVSLVAFAGVGKTALVNKWLLQMGKENYGGAERVFGWSFYSQGAAEGKQVSADLFIATALEWFGDTDPTKGSPWDKGERLAEHVRKQRTLLILDGLEPLQYPPGEMGGGLKDLGLQCVLRELANYNRGLCILTTRLPVDDIKDFIGTWVESADLDNLSPEAGADLLQNLGVKGTLDELKQAARDFHGHALALTLLGSYLAVVYNGDIRQRYKIPKLTREKKQGAHARRVLECYEGWFKGKPELDILHIMGLFDRPAEGGAIEAVRAKPAIKGLTSQLQKLSHEGWQYAVSNLRGARLLAREDLDKPATLDCHPLVREHFGERLKASNPTAWKEAHSRLYEYYKSAAKELPETIEEMAPLFAAVAHGCQAGRHHEALEEVYSKRIQRGNEFFSTRKIGAFGADVAALSSFFDRPWHEPAAELREDSRAFVLAVAGFDLRALGRLREAAHPMQAGLQAAIALKHWGNANRNATNLSQVYLTLGDLAQALDYTRQSVELADRSGRAFERMISRAALADALHHAGRVKEAAALFREAEEMQKEQDREYHFLYSLQGFQYCDLLLSENKYKEVLTRAGQALESAMKQEWLLDIALGHLSLGRAHLLQALKEGTGDFSEAKTHLDRAVDGLRRAGHQDDLPRGLLARAELHRVERHFQAAHRDLDEAMTIATRGGMRLFEAECHLEYARLHLAVGEKDKARESLAIAKEMIDDMGYHRRDKEVRDLEKQLGKKPKKS